VNYGRAGRIPADHAGHRHHCRAADEGHSRLLPGGGKGSPILVGCPARHLLSSLTMMGLPALSFGPATGCGPCNFFLLITAGSSPVRAAALTGVGLPERLRVPGTAAAPVRTAHRLDLVHYSLHWPKGWFSSSRLWLSPSSPALIWSPTIIVWASSSRCTRCSGDQGVIWTMRSRWSSW